MYVYIVVKACESCWRSRARARAIHVGREKTWKQQHKLEINKWQRYIYIYIRTTTTIKKDEDVGTTLNGGNPSFDFYQKKKKKNYVRVFVCISLCVFFCGSFYYNIMYFFYEDGRRNCWLFYWRRCNDDDDDDVNNDNDNDNDDLPLYYNVCMAVCMVANVLASVCYCVVGGDGSTAIKK